MRQDSYRVHSFCIHSLYYTHIHSRSPSLYKPRSHKGLMHNHLCLKKKTRVACQFKRFCHLMSTVITQPEHNGMNTGTNNNCKTHKTVVLMF